MPQQRSFLWMAALCATVLSQASAQGAPPASAVSGPALEHRSAFEGYRPFAAEDVQPWRQSNDTVRDVGGWRVYAREISGAKVPASGPARPADPAASSPGRAPAHPHGGHGK